MIRRKLGFSNTPNYGGTGTSDAFVKINDWGMSLSNQNNTIDFNVDTNLPANITLDYELVGANTNQIPGGVTGQVTLDSNSDFTLSATIDPYYDTTNTSNTTINLTLTSPDSNAVVASAPDLILRQAEALVATGGTITTVSGGTENLPANYTLHELADGDTFSITNYGSNANLTLYGFVTAGGGGAAYGDTTQAGAGGGGGGTDSGNVKLGLGSFANCANAPSNIFLPQGATFNGNVLPTDSFTFNSSATTITDGESVVTHRYPGSVTGDEFDLNRRTLYFVKNTNASNANVNVYSAYTDADLTTAFVLKSGNTSYTFGVGDTSTGFRATGVKSETNPGNTYVIEVGAGGSAGSFGVDPTNGEPSFMGALAASPGEAATLSAGGASGSGQYDAKAGGASGRGGGGGAGTAGNTDGTGGSGTIANILSNASIVYFGGGGAGGRDGVTVPSGGIGGGGEDGNPGEDGKGGGGSGGQKTGTGTDNGGAGGSGAAYVRYLSEYRTLHL